jgi:L-threonylcarbamoyladenylate synthase
MLVADNNESWERAAAVITNGGVIAFRTDTFYGLGADPFNTSAVHRIKELKVRDDGKPILLLIADSGDADRLIRNRSEIFDDVATRFWPGPLTIVGFANEALPREVTAGTGTVGVRLPGDENVRGLVRHCGGALTATSANLSGQPPSRSTSEVTEQFGAGIDLIIDGGVVTATEPSTVLDVTQTPPRLIREGAVKKSDLQLAGFELL